MNILIIGNSSECYGASNSMLDMIDALKKKGISIIVFIPRKGELVQELCRRCIKYYVIPYHFCAAVSNTPKGKMQRLWEDVWLAWRTRKTVSKCDIDLIHTNASNVDFGIILAKICGIPHIWHIRELLYEDYNLKYDFPDLEKKFMLQSDSLIYISRYVAQKRKCGTNYVVCYDGINIHKYMIHKTELFCENVIHILYCGIISREKGTIDAIKAVEKLVEWGYLNIHLDIVGALNEYSFRLTEYVKKKQLDRYITFHGHQKEMRLFRQSADIAVVCSRNEALGRVTIESMLGECLVIGADSGATRELVRDGKNGYLYQAGNAGQLAQKVLSVYQNPEKSKKIIHSAKEYAARQFESDQYAEKVCEIYNKCIKFQ